MKIIMLVWSCLLGLAVSAQAQFSVDWYSIDGGGGTSTGGVYTISGTIGQPDAGRMTGGNYTLEGGFWAIIAAVQTEGAPFLSVQLTSTNTVLISWPHPATGFNLKQNTAVDGPTWNDVPVSPVQVGQQWQVIIAPPTGNRFYRLIK